MDAVEYLKERNRMIEKRENNKIIATLALVESQKPNKAVATVEQWAKEHPVKTYLSVLLEKFPNAILCEDGTPAICPHNLFGGEKWDKCERSAFVCDDFWNREFKEE